MVPPLKPIAGCKEANLRRRVMRLIREDRCWQKFEPQLALFETLEPNSYCPRVISPATSFVEFLDDLSAALPDGNVYLFGGVLRELALFGGKGYRADIDLVVDGEWDDLVKRLRSIGAVQNKFGGFRLCIKGLRTKERLVDIWHARDTWAISEGYVQYQGVQSLLDTTILNWDAILMNWRTKQFICKQNYFDHIQNRVFDIVLIDNPNPLGAAVRAFRHLCLKEAQQVTARAARYLHESVLEFSADTIIRAEISSYQESTIRRAILQFFRETTTGAPLSCQDMFSAPQRIDQPRLL